MAIAIRVVAKISSATAYAETRKASSVRGTGSAAAAIAPACPRPENDRQAKPRPRRVTPTTRESPVRLRRTFGDWSLAGGVESVIEEDDRTFRTLRSRELDRALRCRR
jgi:hypothetical protein